MTLIPKRVIVNTGEPQSIQATIDSFFLASKKLLRKDWAVIKSQNALILNQGKLIILNNEQVRIE